MTNIIPFMQKETDVLTNRNVIEMMQQYYTCGQYRSMLQRKTSDDADGISYAEACVNDTDELSVYGTHCPIHLVRAPREVESFPFIYQNYLAQRVQRIINVAWFHWYDVSPGVLSMVLGKPGNRMKGEIAEVVFHLVECSALIKTDRSMEQPFKPKAVRFSAYENMVLVPTRENLYRCIETAVYLMDNLQKVHQQFAQTMSVWTDQPWPHINNATPKTSRETKHRATS